MPKIAVLQMCSGIDPDRNFDCIRDAAYAALKAHISKAFETRLRVDAGELRLR